MKVIDYTNIDKNIKKILKTNELCIVLKNDAYGFGLVQVLKLGLKNKVQLYAVNTIDEAKLVRRYCDKKIILFGHSMDKLKEIKQYDILPTAGSLEEMVYYSQNQVKFALEIDSGMNRFGIKEFKEDLLKNKYLEMVYIHFYKRLPSNASIMEHIHKLCHKYQKLCHFGGSLVYGVNRYCLRVGKQIYENSMEFYGKVIEIKSIKPGESVGYEGEYIATTAQKIAVLDVGYYNGIRIHFDGYVYCHKKRYPIIGRVCMNHAFVKIDENIQINDFMEFFGKHISLEEFLQHNLMSEYESFLFIR